MQARIYWQLGPGLVALGVWTLIIGGFLMWLKGVPATPRQGGTLLVASLGGAAASLIAVWFMSMLQVFLGANARSGVIGLHEFEIRDDGLFERTEANETLTKWPSIKSITRHSNFIYVEVGPSAFHIIPRSGFSTGAEFENCLEELKRRTRK